MKYSSIYLQFSSYQITFSGIKGKTQLKFAYYFVIFNRVQFFFVAFRMTYSINVKNVPTRKRSNFRCFPSDVQNKIWTEDLLGAVPSSLKILFKCICGLLNISFCGPLRLIVIVWVFTAFFVGLFKTAIFCVLAY